MKFNYDDSHACFQTHGSDGIWQMKMNNSVFPSMPVQAFIYKLQNFGYVNK